MEEKLAEKLHDAREHMRAAHATMRGAFEDLLPPEFVEHRRAARKELLLALRSLLDAAIERTGGA